MASFKRRQPSDYNQSVPETVNVPETHSYQEKHFQPTLNQPVAETHSETEYGSNVTPDKIENRDDKSPRSTFMESSDQPGEEDILSQDYSQNLQGNSDAGTQYSTPDVSSGVSSSPGGFTGYEPTSVAAATGTASAASTVAATSTATATVSSTVASVSSIAVTAAGAVIIAATVILPLVIGVPSAIIFEDISVTDTTVYYTIFFEDYEEDMELTVSLHNDFTNRTHVVESHSISVMEEDLRPNMEYKLTVYGSMGAILDEKTIKTEKSSEPEPGPEPTPTPTDPELDVKNFAYSPQEGTITIDSELTGDTSGLSSFTAVVYSYVDDVRTVLCSSYLTTLDGEQSIPLQITKDKKYSATFCIECIDKNGETKELYSNDLTVFGTPYYSVPTFTFANDTLMVVCGYYDPYSARSDYELVTKVMNSESTEPVISHIPLNSGVTTVENVSGGYPVFEFMAYIQYTENGSTVYPSDSTFDHCSIDDLVTTGTGIAASTQGGFDGELVVTVGECTTDLVAYVRVYSQDSGQYTYSSCDLVSDTTDTYTFDILSSDNTNVNLEFYVESSNSANPMRGAYGNVVFEYASYTGNLVTSPLNPSTDGRGISISFDVDDPYGLWSDYRATVTQVGASVNTLCSDTEIIDGKVLFDNVTYNNGSSPDDLNAILTVTCTQGDGTLTIINQASIHVYYGPTISLSSYLDQTSQDTYDQYIDGLYGEFDEFGSSGNVKELYAYLFQGAYSQSSGEFQYDSSVVSFYLDPNEFEGGVMMDMEIRDSENNLIARLEDATMIQV